MIRIDSRDGGFGDVWMRLIALYTLSGMEAREPIEIAICPLLLDAAAAVFDDRLAVVREPSGPAYLFTYRGPSEVWHDIVRGRRVALPFARVVAARRAQNRFRRAFKATLIRTLEIGRLLFIPPPGIVGTYHGFMQVQAVPKLRAQCWPLFKVAAQTDLPLLREKMHAVFPRDHDGDVPVTVYPSGTSHQIMPPEWAVNHLPGAVFAFHRNDIYVEAFRRRGLRTEIYRDVGELMAVGLRAKRVICTDSFPLHLWQVYGGDVTLILSQQTPDRVVHPGFDGRVISSRAKCCPCVPQVRTSNASLCESGFFYCKTWEAIGCEETS
jgi:hypothetical protein